ncbi:hypothetical protein REPUB_Repub04eG0165600 [Reevesia pubescens]
MAVHEELEMEMELLKLSKFKLQIQALLTESRDLRERDRSATEQIHLLIQKQKQTEEEYSRKLQELQAELASCNESQKKLERKVSYLQNDNALLENKQKELQGTIQSLLQSRDSFVNAYQESTCEMKRSIEAKDRKLAVLSEKINSHLSLFDSIEREAFSVKQVVDNVERICRAHIRHFYVGMAVAPHLQKTISAKDTVIQNLVSEKEVLHFEVRSFTTILQKIQNAVANMNEWDRKAVSSMLESQEECEMVTPKEDNWIQDTIRHSAEQSPNKACSMEAAENREMDLVDAIPTYQKKAFVYLCSYLRGIIQMATTCKQTILSTLVFQRQSACSPLSACSQPQSPANVLSISVNERMDNHAILVHQLDSECSTTQAEIFKDPDVGNMKGGCCVHPNSREWPTGHSGGPDALLLYCYALNHNLVTAAVAIS